MSEPLILQDRYELGELIGAGGSSRVYVGTDHMLERRVAIKVLDRSLAESADPAAHERFLPEARSAARFTHANAVAPYDAGEDGDTLFIVMEFVEGTSLAHLIHNEAPLTDERVIDIGEQLLSALGAAHAAGIVHRDIKPANILVTPTGQVKLADFGIARRFDEIVSSLTAEGMVIGTREYLAPEQARGLETTPATDVYAVGAVLHELATGQRPHASLPDAATGADPRSVRPEVGPILAAAIATATAARPDLRFAGADAFRAALAGQLPPTQLSIADTPPAAAAPTAVMGQARSPETKVMTAPATTAPVPGGPTNPGRGWIIGLVALAAAAIGVLAWAASNDRGDTLASGPTLATAVANTDPPPTVVPVTSVPTTNAATTPPTAPPSEPTTPPTPAPPGELVPGFPDTDDIDQFVEQLRDAKDTAGKQAKKLEEKIDELVDEVDEWVEKEELDPVVASRAIELIDEYDGNRGDSDD